MKTKSLVLAAAALSVGLLSASAEGNVYSVNIVGYVNTPCKTSGLTLVGNPLDNGQGNIVTNLFASLPMLSAIQVWNGAGYTTCTRNPSSVWSTNAFTTVVPPGSGCFVKLGTTPFTNTFVGTVQTSPASRSFPSNSLALVCSPLPIGGVLISDPTFALGDTLPILSTIQTWNNSGAGAFVTATKNPTGIWSAVGSNMVFTVGQGFFVKSRQPTNWVQALP